MRSKRTTALRLNWRKMTQNDAKWRRQNERDVKWNRLNAAAEKKKFNLAVGWKKKSNSLCCCDLKLEVKRIESEAVKRPIEGFPKKYLSVFFNQNYSSVFVFRAFFVHLRSWLLRKLSSLRFRAIGANTNKTLILRFSHLMNKFDNFFKRLRLH